MLVLETKGQDMEQDKVKQRYLDEWAQAVNAHGGFGRWHCAVAKAPGEIRDILIKSDATKGKVASGVGPRQPVDILSEL